MKHVIFFDSTCSLCKNAIKKIQKRDRKKIFSYYPLNSGLARQKLSDKFLEKNTLVLLENGKKVFFRSKAVFRILKLLGGKYAWMGFFVYVPGLDFFYRIVANHRRFFY